MLKDKAAVFPRYAVRNFAGFSECLFGLPQLVLSNEELTELQQGRTEMGRFLQPDPFLTIDRLALDRHRFCQATRLFADKYGQQMRGLKNEFVVLAQVPTSHVQCFPCVSFRLL